jgi:hypothetical protein
MKMITRIKSGRRRAYSDCNFSKLVDEAIGLEDNDNNNDTAFARLDSKIRAATEADLIRLMNEGKWELVSEFKFRLPHLWAWVDSLEHRFWSEKDAVNSKWK